MSPDTRDPAFAEIVGGADLPLERLADGRDFTGGPIWHPYEKRPTFPGMPNDYMRRWSTVGGTVGPAGIGLTSSPIVRSIHRKALRVINDAG